MSATSWINPSHDREITNQVLIMFNPFFFSAVDAVGIFRKSGGKQRINHLKEMIEGDPGTSAADSF